MPTPQENESLRVLISQRDLERKVSELAERINRDYADSDQLIAIGVLKGSVFFMSDLLKQIDVPMQVDFFQAASYGSSTVPGEVRIKRDVDVSIRGKDVLLIEDIVDTGHTLNTILSLLGFREPRSVRLCALLDKSARREKEVKIDYSGFEIDDLFVIGYGLDFNEKYRNLPYIGVLETPSDSQEENE